MNETTVCTLHIKIPFYEWVSKFDIDEASARAEKNIKVLYRGVSKDNPHKAIVIVQAEEGVIDKHIQHNFDTFKKMVQILVLLFQVFGLNEKFLNLIHIFLDD